jgi:HTH-type transcriptional regulator / antitoxin HigA
MLERKSAQRKDLIAAWTALQDLAPVSPIRNQQQYDRLLQLVDELGEIVGEQRSHALAGLLQILVGLVSDYEDETWPIAHGSPREALRLLMEENGLKQGDLRAELGSQGVVSEILSGKREINARQARALAKRFAVEPIGFI